MVALPVLWLLLTEPDRGLSAAALPYCAGSESLAAAACCVLPEPQCDSGPGLLAWGLLLETSNEGGPCSLITFICLEHQA